MKHMPNWETIEVPRGAYIGWGTKAGQHVTGKVTNYEPAGGTDFAGNPCPQLEVELSEKAESFNKEGDRFEHSAGDTVQLTAGQVSLRRALQKANPSVGDLVKITLDGMVKTASGGTVKEFGIQIDRTGGTGAAASPAPKAKVRSDDEPPF